ncbi:hypothetical protein B296_00006455 [Ensete ventricosum]|uniref:Uncharacterized protein n=1 Tax=Ensete ventricosum TaxID=4639 RepID=A0A426ZJ36_ENSVE|nr:hypothetical protein B296_00006455 [Ensete ventricosum]
MLNHFASLPLQCLPRTPSPSSSSSSSSSSISSVLFVSISLSTHLWWHPNRLSDARRCVLLYRGRPHHQIGGGADGRRYSIVCLMESKTEARIPEADGSKRGQLKLEALNWDHSFVRSCLAIQESIRSPVSRVSPSAKVENPELVAWSESVAELLDLDPKE